MHTRTHTTNADTLEVKTAVCITENDLISSINIVTCYVTIVTCYVRSGNDRCPPGDW